MSKISNFMQPKDEPGCEKLYGRYGCKYCDLDVDFAWWNSNKGLMFWICKNNHRSEQSFV
jgi:hypothetical protein